MTYLRALLMVGVMGGFTTFSSFSLETVTLITKDGQRIRGTKKNEDVFSIQLMDQRERIQGYRKSDLQDVIYEKESLMPVFTGERLSDRDLTDLVGYLTSLRGSERAAQ